MLYLSFFLNDQQLPIWAGLLRRATRIGNRQAKYMLVYRGGHWFEHVFHQRILIPIRKILEWVNKCHMSSMDSRLDDPHLGHYPIISPL